MPESKEPILPSVVQEKIRWTSLSKSVRTSNRSSGTPDPKAVASVLGDLLYNVMLGVRLSHTPARVVLNEDEDAHGNPMQFPLGDPRRGKSGSEQCTFIEDDDAQFRLWLSTHKDHIRSGDEITTDEESNLCTLLYLYRRVLAEKPKCPKLIQGVEHHIRLKKGMDLTPKKREAMQDEPSHAGSFAKGDGRAPKARHN